MNFWLIMDSGKAALYMASWKINFLNILNETLVHDEMVMGLVATIMTNKGLIKSHKKDKFSLLLRYLDKLSMKNVIVF